MRRLALATFLGTLAQAPLGAITVYSGLNPWLVMSHFLLALVVLAGGVVVARRGVLARARARAAAPCRASCGAARSSLAAALLALVVSGHGLDRRRPASRAAPTSRRLWQL